MKYQVVIFSYNRDPSLRNCIKSVLCHCPGIPFTVYDDGSDQPDLVDYLKSLGASVRHMQTATADRNGGFYTNMQAALDEAQADALLLLQDDVQVVRDITGQDVQAWQTYWDQHTDCAFLSPVFMKGGRRADFLKYYQPDPNERVYHWVEDPLQLSKDGPVPRYYMDVCLLQVQRLRDVQLRYHTSEWLNGQQAAQHFPPSISRPAFPAQHFPPSISRPAFPAQHFPHGMAQLAGPMVFYVPEEPVYRGRVKTKGTQMAEHLAGNSVKCFVGMSPSEVERMRERSTSTYPFAEDFVQTQDPTVQRPYRFNVYRTHWLARLVNKLEKL